MFFRKGKGERGCEGVSKVSDCFEGGFPGFALAHEKRFILDSMVPVGTSDTAYLHVGRSFEIYIVRYNNNFKVSFDIFYRRL